MPKITNKRRSIHVEENMLPHVQHERLFLIPKTCIMRFFFIILLLLEEMGFISENFESSSYVQVFKFQDRNMPMKMTIQSLFKKFRETSIDNDKSQSCRPKVAKQTSINFRKLLTL